LSNGGVKSAVGIAGVVEESAVILDPAQMHALTRSTIGGAERLVQSEGHWTCLEGGEIAIEFPAYFGGGEASISDKSIATAYLTIATDGSLIVKLAVVSAGRQFPGIPYKSESVTWMRFKRAG
jgi:hypothetical protein